MDALLKLFSARDEMLSEAHKEMSQHKRGYNPRRASLYINTAVAKILFDNNSTIEELLCHPSIAALIADRSFEVCYKIMIPFMYKDEWMLVIVDNSSSSKHDVHFVYPKYKDIVAPNKPDEHCAFNLRIIQKIDSILDLCKSNESASIEPILAVADIQAPQPAAVNIPRRYIFQDPESTYISNTCHRTPNGMPGSVTLTTDSGIYVAYAMECEYFDAPIFAETDDCWNIIRRKFAYWLLCNQMLLE